MAVIITLLLQICQELKFQGLSDIDWGHAVDASALVDMGT